MESISKRTSRVTTRADQRRRPKEKDKVITIRKRPEQKRSRLTYESALEAFGNLIESKGYEKATTNQVAIETGISIGTLYQYFPNKQSMLAVFVNEHLRHLAAELREMAASMNRQPFEECFRVMLKRTFRCYVERTKLWKEIASHCKTVSDEKHYRAKTVLFTDSWFDLLSHYYPTSLIEKRRRVAFLVNASTTLLIEEYLRRDQFGLNIEVLQEECYSMVVSYVAAALSVH